MFGRSEIFLFLNIRVCLGVRGSSRLIRGQCWCLSRGEEYLIDDGGALWSGPFELWRCGHGGLRLSGGAVAHIPLVCSLHILSFESTFFSIKLSN